LPLPVIITPERSAATHYDARHATALMLFIADALDADTTMARTSP